MAVCAIRWGRTVTQPALVGLWLGACLLGCGGQTPAPDKQEHAKSPPPAAIGSPDPPARTQPAAAPQSNFKDAVFEEPPDENQSLPLTTKTGKSVGKLY